MKNSKRINTLVELSSEKETAALKDLGVAQRKSIELQNQIESLKKYRQEYQDKLSHLGNGGLTIDQLIEFRSFIDKLDKAIVGQESVLSQCREQVLLKRRAWENLHKKTGSLQKILDSATVSEMKHEHKREQAEQDERATRLGRNYQNGI